MLKEYPFAGKKFNATLDGFAKDPSLQPWEKVAAAIGYALYNRETDKSIDDVFKRADKAMYECKTRMKAHRD